MSPRRMPRKRLGLLAALAALAAPALVGGAAAARTPIAGRDVFSGKQLALRQFTGRPVFVNVWGSWCGGCTAEAPVLARFARAHRGRVVFLGIDTMDSKAGARRFYARFGLDYPSIWDPRALISGAWSRGAPTTLVFDRKHRLVTRIEGSASLARLNAALRRVT